MHTRVAGVSREPSGVAQAPQGTRHLVGEAHGAGKGQRLAEVLLRRGQFPLVQQHGRTGAQEVRGLLGGGQLPDVRKPFVEQFECAPVFPARVGEHTQRVETVRHAPAVPGRAKTPQGLCERLLGRRRTPRELLLEAQAEIKKRPAPRVVPDLCPHPVVGVGPRPARHRPQHHGEGQPQRAGQSGQQGFHVIQTFLIGRAVALPGDRVEQAQDVLLGETGRRFGAHGREQLPSRGHLPAVEAAQPPEPGEPGHQPQGVRAIGAHETAQRRVQVAVLGGQPVQPGQLVAAAQERLRPLGQPQEVRDVGVPQAFLLACAHEVLGGERADGLQHPIAPLGDLQERLLRQRGQQVLGTRRPAHRLDRLDRRAPGEHGQPSCQLPLLLVQQLPAPLHDATKGAMPGCLGAVAPGQQPEAVVLDMLGEAVGQFVRSQRPQPRRRQLDRQRQPVQGGADVRHTRVPRETGAHRGRPVQEEPRGRLRRQRRHRAQHLAGDPQRLAARGEDPHTRAGAQEQAGDPCHVLDQMLAVVQDEQQLAVLQGGEEPVGGVPRGGAETFAQTEGGEQGVGELGGVGERGELDQANVRVSVCVNVCVSAYATMCVDVRVRVRMRELDRQTGLARSARPGECDQALAGEQGADAREFAVASDEAGQLGGEPPVGGARVLEQFQVEGGQVGRGAGAQLLGQGAPRLLVHRQRLSGPAARVQGPHQLSVQPLAQRMRVEQSAQLRYECGAAAEREVRVDSVLYGGEPQLFETGHLGARAGEVGQGRAAPQGERLPEYGLGPRVVALGEGRSSVAGQPLEAVRVDGVGGDGDAVAGGVGLDPCVRTEPPAQPGDLGLEGVGGSGRRLATVQTVGQPLRGDGPAGVQEEQGEQRAGAGAAGVQGAAVRGADLEGSQDAEAHSADSGRSGRRAASGRRHEDDKKPAHREVDRFLSEPAVAAR